ncbi:MAG: glycosyltransferase family 2 protein [Limnothrix sp. RL_2_0]|nr:glycosyltransferase family 2 protein [Limnothrix sp. RL_2_0]
MLTQPPIEADASVLFSVIATLSKNLDSLESWLDSLLCQGHYQSTEILFVDIYAPHPERQLRIRCLLEEKGDEIAQSPYKFHFMEYRQNVDLNTCLNQAIAAASGKWIYFLHSDDRVLKHTFFEFAAVIKEFASVEVISGRFQSLNQHQELTGKSPELATEGFVSAQFKDLFLYKNPLTSGCTLYRKDILQKMVV